MAWLLFRFLNRHADSDLFLMVSNSVPPCDLSKIDMFKNHLAKFSQKVGSEPSMSRLKSNPSKPLSLLWPPSGGRRQSGESGCASWHGNGSPTNIAKSNHSAHSMPMFIYMLEKYVYDCK